MAVIALAMQGLVLRGSDYRTGDMAGQGTWVEQQEGQESDGEDLQASQQWLPARSVEDLEVGARGLT